MGHDYILNEPAENIDLHSATGAGAMGAVCSVLN